MIIGVQSNPDVLLVVIEYSRGVPGNGEVGAWKHRSDISANVGVGNPGDAAVDRVFQLYIMGYPWYSNQIESQGSGSKLGCHFGFGNFCIENIEGIGGW